MNAVILTIGSAAFAVAVTSLLRRKWPTIDGWAVPVVVAVCTVASAVLAQYAAAIPPLVWTVLGPVVAAVLALGGVQTAQVVAAKGGTAKTISVVAGEPSIVIKPLEIDRDTTPMVRQ
jgi:hypothetical protein